MNRELKFRAWDGEEMLTNSVRRDYDDYYTLDLDGTFYGHTRTGDEYFNADQDDLNKKQYVLMQYTGLKDKNGKEIYEGDIIRIFVEKNYGFAGKHKEEQVAKITFESGCFWWTSAVQTDCNWHFYNAADREVIGNIYEHPDLLKTQPNNIVNTGGNDITA